MDLKAKLRPFYVAKLLQERTNDEHYLTIAQIIDILKNEYDINATRGTISDDIKALQELGMDISVELSTQNRFFLLERKFELPELKVLIDAVESAKFISKNKSTELVNKISSLASVHDFPSLARNVDVENRVKANNEKLLYIMDALNDAINQKKKVSFQYFYYNVQKEKKLKHCGQEYIFSPYKLVWNGDYYYVVGYSDNHNGVGSFRVDRIAGSPKVLDEAQVELHDFDVNCYLNSMFHMFDGNRQKVELACYNGVINSIIDRFGDDVEILPYDMASFKINVEVAVGSVFYSWVFGFGGKVQILSPKEVKNEYNKMIQEAAAKLK